MSWLVNGYVTCHVTNSDFSLVGTCHRWGWCGEGCPLENREFQEFTYQKDKTLTVTTHTVLQVDKDLYVMIGLLVLMAFSLFSFTTTLKRHGTHFTFILLKNKECKIMGFLCLIVLILPFTLQSMQWTVYTDMTKVHVFWRFFNRYYFCDILIEEPVI